MTTRATVRLLSEDDLTLTEVFGVDVKKWTDLARWATRVHAQLQPTIDALSAAQRTIYQTGGNPNAKYKCEEAEDLLTALLAEIAHE